MISAPYFIRPYGGLLTGRLSRYLLLRDADDLMGEEDHAAAQTSSDYFATLALWLDEVCFNLGKTNRREIAKLQRIIDDLLYLYANYEINKKR